MIPISFVGIHDMDTIHVIALDKVYVITLPIAISELLEKSGDQRNSFFSRVHATL